MTRSIQLDRFLLRNSEFSVRQLRRFIMDGEVAVDGRCCRNIHQPVSPFTQVSLGEKVLQNKTARYVMLNKPMGVVSATSHPKHKTVVDCIEEAYAPDLHLAGRLDFNTTGLVILTNDGRWSRNITQPEEKKPKTYLLETEDPITEQYQERFSEGMYFDFEGITLLPAELIIINTHQAHLTIYEGRYHQIKRMFGFFNNKVTMLHRVSMGGIVLDPNLQPGEYRALTEAEVQVL